MTDMIDINRFDDLQDLPISEEMLGAYLEGNLHGSEFREVNNFILSDTGVVSLIDTVEADLDFIRDLDLSDQQGTIDTDVSEDLVSKITIPEISILGMDSLSETSAPLNDDIILGGECANFIGDDDHSLNSDNLSHGYHHHDPELDNGMSDNFE